jgi:hypothetical protein
MLGGFVRLIVGLGLDRLLVVFDEYRVSSHCAPPQLLGCNSDRDNRLQLAARLLLVRINPDLAPQFLSQGNAFSRNDTEQ